MYPWHVCLEVIRSSMSHCWTRWRVGEWLMNSLKYIMSKKSIENPIDGTLKRVHTEVSDSTSSDEESMIKSLNVKKSKITSCKTWPRFLIIGSTDEGALRKFSPFAIDKGLQGLAGSLMSVKKLRNGTLLVECATDSHSRSIL